jgi:hypothetical protein
MKKNGLLFLLLIFSISFNSFSQEFVAQATIDVPGSSPLVVDVTNTNIQVPQSD